jgi:hypothetical protein
MTISMEPIGCKLKIDGRIVEQYVNFNYFGVNITSSGNLVNKLKHKLKISKSDWMFEDLENKNTRNETKNQKYIRQPYANIMIYSLET